MMETELQAVGKPAARHPRQEEIRAFIEAEAGLLDEGAFDAWYDLFAEEGVYWVPAERGQASWLDHVSLYYDDKRTLKIRVQRLNHAMTHCQDPESQCVRVVSGTRIDEVSDGGARFQVRSKFLMLEDRFDKPQRLFGGTYRHTLKTHGEGFRILLKRVDLTNCDQSFPNLTQPF